MASCRNACRFSKCSPFILRNANYSFCRSLNTSSSSINVHFRAASQFDGNNFFLHSSHSSPLKIYNGKLRIFKFYSTYPSHEVVKLPNLSPTMEVGTIVSWEKAEGDQIEEGEVLAIIETDKSTMEMETPEEGYLAKILTPAGSQDIPVNQPIAILVGEEGDISAFQNYSVDSAPIESETVKEPPASPPEPQDSAPEPEVTSQSSVSTPAPPSSASHSARVFASPLARRAAFERNIDINNVVGTGPRGRITIEDVQAHKDSTAAPSSPQPSEKKASSAVTTPSSSAAAYKDIDLTSMRKTIAKRLAESKQTVPHYYLSADINMDKVFKVRQELNESSNGEFKLSVNDFIIKASALSLKKVPQCNSQWMESFIREYHSVDISVAVSTDAGLITPIVFDADKKGLSYINEDVVSLAEKARNKTLQPQEFVGGTFTISNLGMYGVTNFSAVINPPQSCILAVGATENRIIPDTTQEQGFSTAKMMSVTLSCDHRVVDGAVGAQWLKSFRAYLENPMKLLL